MNLPSVAVIIVNYHSGAMLLRCLEAVQRQSHVPRRVIVVDNGSEDGLAALRQRFPELQVLTPGTNLGFAAANNRAAEAASDVDWLALLNPDAFPEPDWLARCLSFAAHHPEYASIGCRLVRADAPDILDGSGDCYHVSGRPWRRDEGWPLAQGHLEDGEILSACAAAALYRRELFLGLGGFDERFFCYLEDVDLGLRLQLAGHRCGYCAGAVVYHAGSAITGRRSDFSVYHGQRNLLWTFVKNLPAALLWRYLPVHLLLLLLSTVHFALRGQFRTILRARRDALGALPAVWRDRRTVQASRRISATELLTRLERGWPGPPRRPNSSA